MNPRPLLLLLLLALSLLLTLPTSAQDKPTFRNPILPGFNPDPSICRVKDDYYLVTSSWEYFPSIPIYHSKDLVNWKIHHYAVTDPAKLDLSDYESYGGVWAPTIRHHQGTFYITFSLVQRYTTKQGIRSIKNLLLTTRDPGGDWQGPFEMTSEISYGIDPALFFDDDGSAYLLLNSKPANTPPNDKTREIRLYTFDLKSHQPVGEGLVLTKGFQKNAPYPEGPRLFKKDGWYYLLISEGGTGFHHAATISRSKKIKGPYQQFRGNPILTHRHLGEAYPYQNIGHCDFVHTQNGEWWAVALGIRKFGEHRSIMGRETFLVPMQWPEGDWPLMAPGTGVVPVEHPVPNLPASPLEPESVDTFNAAELRLHWNYLRRPEAPFWKTRTHGDKGGLTLKLRPEQITEPSSPSFLGRRIIDPEMIFTTRLNFTPNNSNEEAGICVISSHYENIRLVLQAGDQGPQLALVTAQAQGRGSKSIESVHKTLPISATSLDLRVRSEGEKLAFEYSTNHSDWVTVGRLSSTTILGTRHTTGDYVGLYASSNGKNSDNTAIFEQAHYRRYNSRSKP